MKERLLGLGTSGGGASSVVLSGGNASTDYGSATIFSGGSAGA